MEKEKRAFYDYLILVTIVVAGLFGMEGLLLRYATNLYWKVLVFFVFFIIQYGWVGVYLAIVYRRPEEKALQNYLDEWVEISILLNGFLSVVVFLVSDKSHLGSMVWLLVPLAILLLAYGLYRNDRTAKETMEKERRRNANRGNCYDEYPNLISPFSSSSLINRNRISNSNWITERCSTFF